MLHDHSCCSGNVFCFYAVLNGTVSECESWDLGSGVAEDSRVLGCDTALLGEWFQTFIDPEVDGIKILETSGNTCSLCEQDIPEDFESSVLVSIFSLHTLWSHTFPTTDSWSQAVNTTKSEPFSFSLNCVLPIPSTVYTRERYCDLLTTCVW